MPHGRAPTPCVGCIGGCAPAVRQFALLGMLLAVHPCGTPVRSPVFLCFVILGARGFPKHLIFLEMAREVLFSIET